MTLYSSFKNYSNRSLDRDGSFRGSSPKSGSSDWLPKGSSMDQSQGPASQTGMIDLVSSSDEDDDQVAEMEVDQEVVDEAVGQPALDNPSWLLDLPLKSRRTLEPRQMLNDDIVHFYMKHLMDKASQTLRDRIHVFNCFFYQKFKTIYMDGLKGPKGIDPEAIEKLVRRWDKDVKIFDKDFLVIPVCEHIHWVLVIVAYPGLVQPGAYDHVIRNTNKQPAILIFDSLRYKYMSKFTGFIREIFLKYRWKIEKPREEPRQFENRGILTEKLATVPKQRNFYDCGIHMLYSFERFLKDPRLIYQKVMNVEDLTISFKCDTSDMRKEIKKLLPRKTEL